MLKELKMEYFKIFNEISNIFNLVDGTDLLHFLITSQKKILLRVLF